MRLRKLLLLVSLPGLMALNDEFPGFVRSHVESYLPESSYFAGFTLDFNGDNKIDWIGYLLKEKDKYGKVLDLYCICSNNLEYSHLLMRENAAAQEDKNARYSIHREGWGYKRSLVDGQDDITTKYDGVEWYSGGNASIIYYWDGGKVEKFWTAD